MAKKEDLDRLLEDELDKKAFSIDEVNILFLDISTTCTGYSIYTVNFTSKPRHAKLVKAGCLWLDNKDWNHQNKYTYMYNAICNYFWIVEKIDYIVVEEYRINIKKPVGAQTTIEMHGVVKCAAGENEVKVNTILPQVWRKQLDIKSIKTPDGKRNWKIPTADKVKEFVTVPDKVTSNITHKERKTPNDVTDAIAIGEGWCKKFGLHTSHRDVEFNTHIGVLQNVA